MKLDSLSLTDKISINAESISAKLRLNTLAKSVDKDIDALIIEKGISLETTIGEGRFRIYDCTRGNREFRLALIINGLDEIQTETHSVEDHLVKAAKLFNPSVDVSGFRDSKKPCHATRNIYILLIHISYYGTRRGGCEGYQKLSSYHSLEDKRSIGYKGGGSH